MHLTVPKHDVLAIILKTLDRCFHSIGCINIPEEITAQGIVKVVQMVRSELLIDVDRSNAKVSKSFGTPTDTQHLIASTELTHHVSVVLPYNINLRASGLPVILK